ncbi:DUF2157 domain-containing protein [Pontibacter cellulosilyticus]|uniref:DUF2157 domain-containing protein n=1 Tax=Pontibacter cellulosilyticus TaxID=1720253 RepID=A0A923N549_9BACT|nr:DUF2157 domain-containing protein [Pontibacter cellulosilyticus]MBC5992743.1 DUF2157 domain-containing protein [Pontibacter cellulosilyticus]
MKGSITRELIYSIARHSNWRATGVAEKLRSEKIYATPRDWASFLRLFLLGTGASFTLAGIIFFFAYNWAEMHKFLKLGLIEFLLLATTAAALFWKGSKTMRNVLLTASAVLVGVLFAVFGQIYQTGANAFDFFFGWTYFVVLWVLVANFQPLWFIFLALLNTTLILYTQQVATYWTFNALADALFILNVAAVIIWEFLAFKGKVNVQHRWFPRIVGLAAITAITISMVSLLYAGFKEDYGMAYLLGLGVYSVAIWYGLRSRDLFYLSAIPFSAIAVVTAVILRIGEHAMEIVWMLATLFVIGSITFLIQYLSKLNRQWHGKY